MAQAKKKKRFFDVDMPLLKKRTQLYAFKIEDIDKRIIKYDLTRMLKGKSSLINLKVQVDKEKLEASSYPIEFRILPYFMKRMIRKRTDYVEDSFQSESKDAIITIKPFLITRRRVHRVVKKAIRDKTKEELENYIKNKTSNQIFEDILKNKLQKELSLTLKKIYPLSLCEIRRIKVDSFKEKETKETKKETPGEKENKTETIEEKKETKTTKKNSKKEIKKKDSEDKE